MIRTYAKLWEILTRQERIRFLALVGLTTLMSIFEVIGVAVIFPFLQVLSDPEIIEEHRIYAALYNRFRFDNPEQFVHIFGILALALIIGGMAFRAATTYVLTRYSLMRSYSISSRLLAGFLRQPYAWFLTRHSSDITRNVLSEVDSLISGVVLPALTLIANVLVTVLITGLLILVEPWVAIGAATGLLVAYAIVYWSLRNTMRRVGTARFEANKLRFHLVQEAVGGIKEAKVMGLEEGFISRFRVPAYAVARNQATGHVLGKMPRFALEAVSYGGFIIAALVLFRKTGGDVTDLVPVFGVLGMAGTKLFPALQQIYAQVSIISFNLPTLEGVVQNLRMVGTAESRVRDSSNPQCPRERIELRRVSFCYPEGERATLRDLSISINAGQVVGLVGGTGSGKTTTVDIILGLLQPSSGGLFVDGRKVNEATVQNWQACVGYVPQTIFLSDDTLAANIAFGVESDRIDMQRVESAARAANIHDFILETFEDGYQTAVGERGVRLSGGQRQRIGIARALYHDPDVIVLDEATSALDNVTERAVMEAIFDLSGSKTVIMIAHRLSTVRRCDKICVLAGGQLVEEGDYDSLIAKGGEFARLAQASEMMQSDTVPEDVVS